AGGRGGSEGAGGTSAGLAGAQWIEAVRGQTGSEAAASLVNELGVEAINVDDDDKLPRYIGGVLARLQEVWVGPQIAEVKSKLQRMSPVEQGDEYHALFGDLVAMEAYRRSLLEQASGDDLTAGAVLTRYGVTALGPPAKGNCGFEKDSSGDRYQRFRGCRGGGTGYRRDNAF